MRNERDVLAVAKKNKSRDTLQHRNTAIPDAATADKDHERSAGYDPYDHTPAALSEKNTANSVVNMRVVSTSAE